MRTAVKGLQQNYGHCVINRNSVSAYALLNSTTKANPIYENILKLQAPTLTWDTE